MNYKVNQVVVTPIGTGRVQGSMRPEGQEERALVRLPIDNTTGSHLRDANCLTPRAQRSGLWTFTASELD